jgi:hypothetical protein
VPDISRRVGSSESPDAARRHAARAKTDRRIAWWLVRLYPPAFRDDVGLGLVDAIEDRMRALRDDGASPFASRLPAIADTLRNAPIEWVAGPWTEAHSRIEDGR